MFGSVIGDDSATRKTEFTAWKYSGSFDGVTGTSKFAKSLTAKNDELHVVVYDNQGTITGTQGTVLETFPYLSTIKNAKNADGTSNYYKDVLKSQSAWIYAGVPHKDSGTVTTGDFGSSLLNGEQSLWGEVAVFDSSGTQDFGSPRAYTGQRDWSFSGGNNGSIDIGTANYVKGYDHFEDADNIEVDFLIAPKSPTDLDAKTVVNDLVTTAESLRKDCVVVASPSQAAITAGTNADVITNGNGYTKSSYLIQDNNFLKVYDKYNDTYINIPAASSTAGLMASTDLVAAPWFSPAGARRGRYLGITDISLSPTKAERDALYKVGINPIANIPGEGVILYGDKTNESRPSAFDRINVRRLFLGIERAIGIAGRNVMFEFNDEFTRAEFVNIVEPFLREIQGRRGITDFKVICDATNNTPAVVARNEFIANIFIKPARSINYVTLNFVAVRTGVDFEEVVGTV